ncbi:MAG: MoaD/ThiS family protein [Candidatus Sericytochromatia bacterium]|nr:MoaD/ThiS family protein [Candidatus Sericytochromatia bacterium]
MSDARSALTFQLSVKLFALLREQVGHAALTLELPVGTCVRDLAQHLRAAEPRLTPFLEVSRVAVNLAFAPPEQVLQPSDEVALIPPVGGG